MRLVIALGGNALGKTPSEQLELVKKTAKQIVKIIKKGNEVVIVHGNGPQVGMINLAFDNAYQNKAGTPLMPFAECGAMSQGYIGYHLQQAISDELREAFDIHHDFKVMQINPASVLRDVNKYNVYKELTTKYSQEETKDE